jgi:hypothetical protein
MPIVPKASHQNDFLEKPTPSARSKVITLIAEGCDQEAMAVAVKDLISSCPIRKDELATKAFPLGQGTWQVILETRQTPDPGPDPDSNLLEAAFPYGTECLTFNTYPA